jgi:DNA (cytosine-5)-methyltransferase 1
MKPTFGSLFAGVGGFDMGMEQAGWECKFQVEWDKHCQHILNKHWPDIPKWGDVSTVSGTEIPPVDCIIFGSPCQDLSVAGKRAGLQGERSGLFYEAVRIIKEMRHVTNGTFPRWAIWENVAGALSSNNGRDFAAVISEMAEAGAVLQEYALLDAQYFGVPQRRRRVFLVACFDSAIARNCPDPLLPVSESLRGNTAKGKPKGQAVTSETSAGFGNSGFGKWSETDTAITLSARDHKSSNTIVGSLAARDYKGVGSQYVDEGKVIVEPFVKSRRAQTSDDDETWIEGEVNPTLNSFDMGDTRSTTAIIQPVLFENSYRDGARIANDGVTQTLSAKMGTGGGNTPMIAIPIQDGREMEKNQNGLGVASSGDPSYTLDQTGAQSVAIGIQGTVIGRQDHNGPGGKGHTEEGDPMFTLTSTDVHAVACEEPTVFQPGTMVRLGGGVWEGTVPTLRAEAKRGDNEPHIHIHDGEPTMAVRRLTPLECERLMGWPDDHTRWKADGTEQADTHRYKQCGNGVASPVARWIASHILKAHQ